MIAISGGKDSHFQFYMFKEILRMNPLLVSVEDNFKMRETGKHNIKNISETFGCELISMKPNAKAQKSMIKYTFEKLTKKDLNFFQPPVQEDLDKLEPIYLSYFVEWNSFNNYELAKRKGFHDLTHERYRTHYVENFDQIDTPTYLVHSWMKYPKFGHASATDYAARMVRYGLINREEAFELVKKHDNALDSRSVREFCEFMGYTEPEFWEIVDTLYNEELFKKDDLGNWSLR